MVSPVNTPPLTPRSDCSAQAPTSSPLAKRIMAHSSALLKKTKNLTHGIGLPQEATTVDPQMTELSNAIIFGEYLRDLKKLSSAEKEDIDAAITHCHHLAQNKKAANSNVREDICNLIHHVALLGKDKYDIANALSGKAALQHILSPKMAKIHNDEAFTEEDLKLEQWIAKAQLAVKYGHGKEPTPLGANGACIHWSLENEKIGLFKPVDRPFWSTIVLQGKKVFGQARLLNSNRGNQQFAEVAAYKLDRKFKFNLTPAAKMAKIGDIKGVFIEFLEGYEMLSKLEGTLNDGKDFYTEEKTKFQLVAIFDFLTGNLDGHSENIFLKWDGNKILEIKPIDYGNSFIEKNPGTIVNLLAKLGFITPRGNQYAWGSLNVMKGDWTDDTSKFVGEMKEAQLNEFINDIRGKRPAFMTRSVERCLKERFHIITHAIPDKRIPSPRRLSKIHTSQDIRLYLDEEFKNKERGGVLSALGKLVARIMSFLFGDRIFEQDSAAS